MKRIMLLSLFAAAVVAVAAPQPAHAVRKIIDFYDEILPAATLSDNGRSVLVQIEGDTAEFEPGLRTSLTVIVYQETTDALAVGHHRSPFNVDLDVIPERLLVDVKTHAVGRNRFVEGWVEVTYFAEEIENGKVLRTWSRTEDVFLMFEAD